MPGARGRGVGDAAVTSPARRRAGGRRSTSVGLSHEAEMLVQVAALAAHEAARVLRTRARETTDLAAREVRQPAARGRCCRCVSTTQRTSSAREAEAPQLRSDLVVGRDPLARCSGGSSMCQLGSVARLVDASGLAACRPTIRPLGRARSATRASAAAALAAAADQRRAPRRAAGPRGAAYLARARSRPSRSAIGVIAQASSREALRQPAHAELRGRLGAARVVGRRVRRALERRPCAASRCP